MSDEFLTPFRRNDYTWKGIIKPGEFELGEY